MRITTVMLFEWSDHHLYIYSREMSSVITATHTLYKPIFNTGRNALVLRPGKNSTTGPAYLHQAAVQRRRTVQFAGCAHCQLGNGRLTTCVVVTGYASGCCGNCIPYGSPSCYFGMFENSYRYETSLTFNIVSSLSWRLRCFSNPFSRRCSLSISRWLRGFCPQSQESHSQVTGMQPAGG